MALSNHDRKLAMAEYRKFFGSCRPRKLLGAVSEEQVKLAWLRAYELGTEAVYAKLDD